MMANRVSLPPKCQFRPATAQDIRVIRKLVLSALLDPTQLKWQQFWLIECEGEIVACGQLRSFPDAQELGSLVVARQWRGQGLGQALTQQLIQQADRLLYLECLGNRLTQFYTKAGFEPVSWSELPPSLKRKFGLSKLVTTALRIPLSIMQYRQ